MADLEMEDTNSLKMLEEMLTNAAEPGKMPSRKQILEMLESSELSDEVKENMKMMLNAGAPQLFGTNGGTYLGVLFVLVIFLIMLFFGYKLYKSIKDKEIKREEKKKQKQMKKKK